MLVEQSKDYSSSSCSDHLAEMPDSTDIKRYMKRIKIMQDNLMAYQTCRLHRMDVALLKGIYSKKPIEQTCQIEEELDPLFFPNK